MGHVGADGTGAPEEAASPPGGTHRAGLAQRTKRSAGGRPPREKLTPLQLRGITALLTQPSTAAAAAAIGVHPRTLSRWFNERAFVNEYGAHTAALQEELWRTMLAVRAEVWDRFIGLVRSDGERVALRASVWFLTPILAEPPARQAMVEEERAIPPRLRELLEGTGAFGSGEGGDAA